MKKQVFSLVELVAQLNQPAATQYGISVIDNSPPQQVPVYGKNFFWIAKSGVIPTSRHDLEVLFKLSRVKIEPDQKLAIFNHHDLKISYTELGEGVEAYEFSHTSSVLYSAMFNADANMISHMLCKTFHEAKVVLTAVGLSDDELILLKKSHWLFGCVPESSDEATLVYHVAKLLSGGSIVPDPKRYREGDHDQLVKSGVATDQYAVPAIFAQVEIKTNSSLDKTFITEMKSRSKHWKTKAEKIKSDYHAALLQAAEDDKLRAEGVLLKQDAMDFINSHAPILGLDFTNEPWYPSGRYDIAAISRLIENGGYGYTAIYIVWVDKGVIKFKELINSARTKDYLFLKSVEVTDIGIAVGVYNFSESPFERTFETTWLEISETPAPEPMTEEGQMALGMAAFAGDFADGTNRFLSSMARQRARMSRASLEEESEEEKLLNTLYAKEYGALQDRFPNLFELCRLNVIVEVYQENLVRKTFSLLELIEDEQTVNNALEILGEMAMMDNSPNLYNRLLEILTDAGDERRREILNDSRIEYQLDENIAAALNEYES